MTDITGKDAKITLIAVDGEKVEDTEKEEVKETGLSELMADKVKTSTKRKKGFDVITETLIAVNGSEVDKQTKLYIKDAYIRNVFCWSNVRPTDWTVSLGTAVKRLPSLKKCWNQNYANTFDSGDMTQEAWEQFCEFIDAYFVKLADEVKSRTSLGMISYDDLQYYFAPGTKLVYSDDPLAAGEVVSSDYVRSFFGESLSINLHTIKNVSGKPVAANHNVSVPAFGGTIKLTSLPVRIASEEDLKALEVQGRLFREMATKAAYMSYSGAVMRRSHWSNSEYKAHGRCVIDPKTMQKVDPEYFSSNRIEIDRDSEYDDDGEPIKGVDTSGIPDSKLWMCHPWVYGFSFTAKVWGEFRIDQINNIQFRENAFDKLVLDETRKKTIRALVENNGSSFSDLIEGKGGGCIFLLHGPPGTGKTLTAEAVAEVLERPLYSVSVGELGTDPEKLEKSLRTILEVSVAWNAVVLLDEADIFLEARNEENILRNAMVGVFLRLLEYHQGVLFLTTNRVKNFDKAFHSRISVAINYPEMTQETRQKVWNNLLEAADVKGMDTSALSTHAVNGRQIKNIVRLAQTLAKSEKREVTQQDLNGMITVAESFNSDTIQ